MHRRFFLILVLLLLVLPISLRVAAQDESTRSVEIVSVTDDNFPELTLLVNVRDEFGVPVSDLSSSDFVVSVDNAAASVQSIENITRDELAISVVLVIDTSSSMYGLPLANTQDAALAFLDNLAPGDEVALLGFDSSIKIAQDFTTDLDLVRSAIEGLEAGGRTALYDGVYNAADLATQANNPRRFVVFLTDGNEYGGLSTNPAQAGIDLATENNIPFYVIGLGFSVDESYLTAVATETQGRVHIYPDSTTLTELYTFLSAYLRTQYIITIDSGLEPDGGEHNILVETADGISETTYTTPDLYPQIALEGLPEQTFDEPVTFTVTISAVRGLGENTVFIDDISTDAVFESIDDTTVSAEITLDPFDFAPDIEHTLTVEATDALGGTRQVSAAFFVEDLAPVFEIVGLSEGDVVDTGVIDVSVEVQQSQQPIDQIAYFVDDEVVATFDSAPYDFSLDILPFGPGDHTFTVELTDATAASTEVVTFSSDPALFVTPSPIPTNTPLPTFTPTDTLPPPTATNTPEPTEIDAIPDTPEPPTATDTPEPPTATDTPVPPTDTSTPEPPTATSTLEPTEVSQIIPTDTPEPEATDTPEPPTATDTPEPPTDTPEPPTATDSPEPPPSDTPAPPTETIEPTVTATPVPPEPVEADDDSDSNILPIAGGIILLLFLLILFYILRSRREDETPPASS